MHKSDLNAAESEIEAEIKEKSTYRSAAELLARISELIAEEDGESAQLLLQEAEESYSANASFTPVLVRCKALVDRAGWMETALIAMRQDLEEDRFSAAMGHFRQALTLSRGIAPLKAVADRQAVRESNKLLPHNWRVAETMLQEAATTEPFLKASSDLQAKLRQAREDESLSNAIYRTDRATLDGKIDEARRQLLTLRAAYPADSRIQERLYALDHPEEITALNTLPQSEVSAPDLSLRSAESPQNREPDSDPATTSKPARAKIVIPNSTWIAVKNFAALATTTAMLGAAGFLLWEHFSRPSIKAGKLISATGQYSGPELRSHPATPVHVAATNVEPPDEEAWDLVTTTTDASIVRAFLNTYPTSQHVMRAKMKLEELEWNRVDRTKEQALEAYLRTYPDSSHQTEGQRLLSEIKSKKAAAADAR